MNDVFSKIIGLILLGVSVSLSIDLAQGIPAGGIVKMVNFFGISADNQQLVNTIGTGMLLLLSLTMGARALIWNRVCIGKSCRLPAVAANVGSLKKSNSKVKSLVDYS